MDLGTHGYHLGRSLCFILFMFCLFFKEKLSHSSHCSGCLQTCSVVKDDLEVPVLPPSPNAEITDKGHSIQVMCADDRTQGPVHAI